MLQRFAARARLLRESQTSAEAVLWRALRNRQLARWKFRRQFPIAPYVVEFVCLDAKLIVELDGATHSSPAEMQRDQRRTRALELCGFHLMRFHNREIYENLSGVLETVLAELEHRIHL